MCKGHVPYNKDNLTKFKRHMEVDHSAFFGSEYLLAGCKMSEEERLAVTDVVSEKDSDLNVREAPIRRRGLPLDATLEEVAMDKSRDVDDPSEEYDEDPLAHVSVKKENQSFRSDKKSNLLRKKMNKVPKREQLINRRRSAPVPRRNDIPDGEGFPCKECNKPFKTQAMADFHFTDVHVQGHFPCKGGCGKIFTSKNKMSSHWSRNCNQRRQSRNSL